MRSGQLRRLVGLAAAACAGVLVAAPTAGAIVGGARATGNYPWIAYVSNGSAVCTGELVTPTKVLTAAHCTFGDGDKPIPVSNYHVWLGRDDVSGLRDAQASTVSKAAADPQYSPRALHDGGDLAVLTLTRADDAQPLSVVYDQQSALDKPGTKATILGFGATVDGGFVTNILQKGQIPIQPISTCNKANGEDRDPAFSLCVGAGNGVAPCHGDSGGPLVVSNYAGQPVLVGVAQQTGGFQCGQKGRYDLYSRLRGVEQGAWLDRQIGSNAGPTGSQAITIAPVQPAIIPNKNGQLAFRFINPTLSDQVGTATLSTTSARLGKTVKLKLAADHTTIVRISLSRAALRQLKSRHSLHAQLSARTRVGDTKPTTVRQAVLIKSSS